LVLAPELLSGFLKRRSCLEQAGSMLALQFQIPVFSEIRGMGQALVFRRFTPVVTVEIRVTLPESAILPLVEVEFSSHQ